MGTNKFLSLAINRLVYNPIFLLDLKFLKSANVALFIGRGVIPGRFIAINLIDDIKVRIIKQI